MQTGAYCIKILPEKNSDYLDQSFFSCGKVNGKNHANLSFQILPDFFILTGNFSKHDIDMSGVSETSSLQ